MGREYNDLTPGNPLAVVRIPIVTRFDRLHQVRTAEQPSGMAPEKRFNRLTDVGLPTTLVIMSQTYRYQ